MRLLSTSTYALHKSEEIVPANPKYAILSHRWEQEGEVTFETLDSASLYNSNLHTPSLDKIRNACAKAREQKLNWLWIDTCCINKTNAVEETKSINAMFEWYHKATVCYAYLRDVERSVSGSQMFKSQDPKRPNQKSVWFERGWTLQELLAPQKMEFYDKNWDFMGTKEVLTDDIHSVTGIDKKYLAGGGKNLTEASVATRMSWMAGRVTTEAEDIAYSMLGILNVNMTLQYGEGPKAFMRLQRTLMEGSADESIFAWSLPTEGLKCYPSLSHARNWAPKEWGLLAPSPDCFRKSGDLVILQDKVVRRLSGGYRWTQQGVQFQMPMKSGTEATNMFGLPRTEVSLALNCWRYDKKGKPLTIIIQLLKDGDVYKRVKCNALEEKKDAKPSTNRVLGIDQGLTRPLTIVQPGFDPLV